MSKPQPPLDTDDALNPKFNASALDFLLIELVPLAQRVTEQLQTREQVLIDEYKRSKIFNRESRTKDNSNDAQDNKVNGAQTTNTITDGAVKDSAAPAASENITTLGFPAVNEETREGILWRLDGLGYRVGQGIVER